MEKASRGGFAFISWKVYQKDIISRNFVDKFGNKLVYQVRKIFWFEPNIFVSQARGVFNTPSNLAWAFQSGSQLKPKFDRIIRRLTEV